jgi:hypothetical protein
LPVDVNVEMRFMAFQTLFPEKSLQLSTFQMRLYILNFLLYVLLFACGAKSNSGLSQFISSSLNHTQTQTPGMNPLKH